MLPAGAEGHDLDSSARSRPSLPKKHNRRAARKSPRDIAKIRTPVSPDLDSLEARELEDRGLFIFDSPHFIRRRK